MVESLKMKNSLNFIVLLLILEISFAWFGSPRDNRPSSQASTLTSDLSFEPNATEIMTAGKDGDIINQYVSFAKKFDLFIYYGSLEKDAYISKMRAINPDLIALKYLNLVSMPINDPERGGDVATDDWFLRDDKGNFIDSTERTGLRLVDIGNEEYRNWVGEWVRGKMENAGYDGVFADNFSVYVRKWRVTGYPINPRTGKTYEDEEWAEDFLGLIRRVKSIIGDGLFYANGIWNGDRFYGYMDLWERLLPELDGIMSEALFHPDEPRWYSEAEWEKCLDMLSWIQNNFVPNGKLYGCWASCSQDFVPPGATKQQVVNYVYASFLLGIKDFSKTYVTMRDAMHEPFTSELLKIDVGYPIEDYRKREDSQVFEREYSNVKVLVNPTYVTYTVHLDDVYRTLDGQVMSQITITPHTGLILLKYSSDKTPPTTEDDYTGTWHTADFVITLTSMDDVSGVNATYYRVDGGKIKSVQTDGQPYITKEGYSKLEYWSVDGVGNEETHHILIPKLDKNPPMISITSPSNGSEKRSSSVTITWIGADTGSGIDHYEICLEQGSWITVGTETTYVSDGLNDGNHTVTVLAVDEIGASQASSVSFIVNTSSTEESEHSKEADFIRPIVVIALGTLTSLTVLIYLLKRERKRITEFKKL